MKPGTRPQVGATYELLFEYTQKRKCAFTVLSITWREGFAPQWREGANDPRRYAAQVLVLDSVEGFHTPAGGTTLWSFEIDGQEWLLNTRRVR